METMTKDDFQAELQALVDAYDEHGGRWCASDENALYAAVERARKFLPKPTKAMEHFNINDYVWVRLADDGRFFHRKQWLDFFWHKHALSSPRRS